MRQPTMLAVPLVLLALAAGPAAPYGHVPLYDEAPRATAADRAWLAAGDFALDGLGRDALLDLRRLRVNGVPVAGWAHPWRYVWPRDAAFVAAAFARTGHVADAVGVLAFLQDAQGADGSFHARYEPDGSGPPDARGVQDDGTGWVLWALAEVAAADPAAVEPLRVLLDRSAHRLAARQGLPPPSSDYWERRERRLTLGVAALALAGLDAAAHVYRVLGDPASAAVTAAAADRTARALVETFGPGYPRYAGGDELDAAVAFLLPPFQSRTIPGAALAAERAVVALRRPAGGLSPGEGWHDNGVSWTPETALFALTAATAGDRATARHWLGWLARHRTASGALPEKVLADGSPAAVAPLAWTAALVVLALTAKPACHGPRRAATAGSGPTGSC